MGLKAGDELEERPCALEPLIGFRIFGGTFAGAMPVLFGSKDDGMAMNEGLPIAPALVGPNVGVDEADLMVAGEVSVLVFGSKVTVLSTRVPGATCSGCCKCIFRNDEGVAGATSPAAEIDPVRFRR